MKELDAVIFSWRSDQKFLHEVANRQLNKQADKEKKQANAG